MIEQLQRMLIQTIGGLRSFSPTYLPIISLTLLGAATPAYADWHLGKIISMGHAYDGQTITFKVSGWVRSNCTCYSPWPDAMCLDRMRTSFSEDYAWLLRARATGQQVWANIDENSCRIIALFESD